MAKERKFSYSLHPGFEMIAGMKEKTGRALEEWEALVREAGLVKSSESSR
jgi:hypothetical protein